MLQPDDRKLYSSCLAAPLGYRFDCGVGMTYSLDLESALFAHLCLASSGTREPDETLNKDPVSLLEAVQRLGERLTIFHHVGETNAPSLASSIYALMEQGLVPAKGRGGDARFHPKLWLLRFVSSASQVSLLRAVVLSRNLTTSRAWDTLVCLEGEPGRDEVPDSAGLAELVRAAPKLASPKATVSAERLKLLNALAHDAERTPFGAPPPFTRVSLVAVGVDQGRPFMPTETGTRVLAISPFVSAATLRALRGAGSERTLISRAEEMAKLDPDALSGWTTHTLHDAAGSDAEATEDAAPSAEPAPRGLHAKALAIQGASSTTWYLGSGNLTDPVRSGSSVELMVRLTGPTRLVGVTPFLEGDFGKLLVEYEHSPAPDDPQEGARAAVQRAKRLVIEGELKLSCVAQEATGCCSSEDTWRASMA